MTTNLVGENDGYVHQNDGYIRLHDKLRVPSGGEADKEDFSRV
jgi:hypothetical protein